MKLRFNVDGEVTGAVWKRKIQSPVGMIDNVFFGNLTFDEFTDHEAKNIETVMDQSDHPIRRHFTVVDLLPRGTLLILGEEQCD